MNGVLVCMVLGYTCFVAFIGREGIRSLRAFTEVELAGRIHASLVPVVKGAHGPWEYYGRSVPSGEVGGDLVDVVPIDAGWIGYVADVSGHGVASGVVMAMVKSGARMQLRREFDVARLASELNDVLCTLLEPNMFVTAALVLGRTDGRLDIASAGHLPVVRVSAADRRPESLISSGVALGVIAGQPFFKREVVAAKGDVFLLLTDGVDVGAWWLQEARGVSGEGAQPPGVLGLHAARRERRRPGGEGLRRRGPLAGHVGLRHRSLLDRDQRRAGAAVEEEEMTHLGALRDRRDALALFDPVEEHRLRGEVVVPQVVVHGLEVPDELAARRAQRDHRIGPAILAAALAAVEVRRGAAGRQEDEPEFRIVGTDRPDVGGAGAVGRIALPGRTRGVRGVARHRVPGPEPRAAARSCVFAAFPDEPAARAAASTVPEGWEWFVARGIDRSPVHGGLGC